jgi:hypothetical protein
MHRLRTVEEAHTLLSTTHSIARIEPRQQRRPAVHVTSARLDTARGSGPSDPASSHRSEGTTECRPPGRRLTSPARPAASRTLTRTSGRAAVEVRCGKQAAVRVRGSGLDRRDAGARGVPCPLGRQGTNDPPAQRADRGRLLRHRRHPRPALAPSTRDRPTPPGAALRDQRLERHRGR